MRFLPGNAQHIGGRNSQQDSYGFADPFDQEFIEHGGFLAVLCDGMGGMEHGDDASRTAVQAFLDAYRRKLPGESIPGALERSAREANGQVVALAQSLDLPERIGTTLVAAALRGGSLFFISVGDSGIFHCAGGEIYTLNRPHTFANVLDAAVARGALSREDADAHPERESLTSFIGAESLDEIDRNVEPYPLDPGDTILLASDGLFKTLDTAEIRASLAGDPQSWPDVLVERTIAKKQEFQDNVTVVSVTIEADAPGSEPAVMEMPSSMERTALRMPAPAPEPSSRRIWPLIVILILLAAGAAGWWMIKDRLIDPPARQPAPLETPAPK